MRKRFCLRSKRSIQARRGLFCERCLKALSSATSDQLSTFLETIDSPSAILGRDLTFIISNTLLNKMLKMFAHDVIAMKIGDALECLYAVKHGPCGKDPVCLHCGIKRVVDLTSITGEKFSDIPLVLRHASGEERTLHFTFGKLASATLIIFKNVAQVL